MMEQVFRLLFVGLLGGLWLSLEEAQCKALDKGIYNKQHCYNTNSGKTCFAIFLVNSSHPLRKPFNRASNWCNSKVTGSTLIIINSLESQRNLESFIGLQGAANETIITDAQKLPSSVSFEWSWVNGHLIIPENVSAEQLPGLDGACVESKHGQSLAYCAGVKQSEHRYICEYSDSKSAFSYRHNNKSFVASEEVATWYDARTECLRLGGDLASITDIRMIEKWSRLEGRQSQKLWIGLHRNKWIWNSTGAAFTYTNWEVGYPNEFSDKQCLCINPQCRRENDTTICNYDRKWRTCNCHHNYTIVCQKRIVVTGKTLSSTSGNFKSSVSLSVTSSLSSSSSSSVSSSALPTAKSPSRSNTTARKRLSSKAYLTTRTTTAIDITNSTKTPLATTPTKSTTATTNHPVIQVIPTVTTYTTIIAAEVSSKTDSSLYMTQKPPNHFPESQTTALASSTTGLFGTKEILLILLFLAAVVIIIVAVLLVIRKRKYDRRKEGSSVRNKKESETVSSVYAAVVPVNRPSVGTIPPGNTIYTDVEMTQQPTSFNTIYASVQPTSEAIDLGKSVEYADINFPQKGKQKPRSADKITACLSPIYSQPFEPRTSASNSEYAEPFKPDKRPTATAPVINHNAAVDPQDIYSLAKAIPLGDPSVIYSEPNKPSKSSTPTGKAVKATCPIYLNMIEVKPGAESGIVAIQDPTAVYAEPIKQKKSP